MSWTLTRLRILLETARHYTKQNRSIALQLFAWKKTLQRALELNHDQWFDEAYAMVEELKKRAEPEVHVFRLFENSMTDIEDTVEKS